jgi:hypothetical protein
MLICFLSITAAAGAAGPKAGKWESTYVQLGYELSFRVSKGKVKKFGGYVLEQCDGSSTRTQTAVSVDKAMKIKNGKFSVREKVTDSGVTVITTVKGRFTSRKKAVGTVRSESIVAGSTCDTYKLDWKAKRA